MTTATLPARPAKHPVEANGTQSEELEALGMPGGKILTHLDLPDRDPTQMENHFENPQTTLLNDVALSHFVALFGAGGFLMAANSGIYYRVTDPFLRGCLAPDWFVVPGATPLLDGRFRGSYVLWNEPRRPTLVIEYVSKTGAEERDREEGEGKFWLYENTINAPFYAIFDPVRLTLEVWHLVDGTYQRVEANEQGRFAVPPLRLELGMWRGTFQAIEATWLRLWDSATGRMLPTNPERVEALREQLRAAGIDPAA